MRECARARVSPTSTRKSDANTNTCRVKDAVTEGMGGGGGRTGRDGCHGCVCLCLSASEIGRALPCELDPVMPRRA